MHPLATDAPRMVLLLTATIDPGNTPFVTRQDPTIRRADYEQAFRHWLRAVEFDIVLCENTDADLTSFHAIAQEFGATHRVELLTFDGNSDAQRLGKSIGECRIIEHALAHSRILERADQVMKVTGRLVLSNVDQFIRAVHASPAVDAMVDIRLNGNMGIADSRVFVCRPSFLREHLLPGQSAIDDNAGFYFEHLLARAVHSCAGAGKPWSLLPTCATISGFSASTGRRYSSGLLSRSLHRARWMVRRRLLA